MANQVHQTDNSMLLLIRQGGTLYGLPALSVREVISMPVPTPLPCQPAFMDGLYSYKGNMIPVISFQWLCTQNRAEAANVCIVIQSGENSIGLAVSEALKIVPRTGDLIQYDNMSLNSGLLKIAEVLRDGELMFVIDMPATLSEIKNAQ